MWHTELPLLRRILNRPMTKNHLSSGDADIFLREITKYTMNNTLICVTVPFLCEILNSDFWIPGRQHAEAAGWVRQWDPTVCLLCEERWGGVLPEQPGRLPGKCSSVLCDTVCLILRASQFAFRTRQANPGQASSGEGGGVCIQIQGSCFGGSASSGLYLRV